MLANDGDRAERPICKEGTGNGANKVLAHRARTRNHRLNPHDRLLERHLASAIVASNSTYRSVSSVFAANNDVGEATCTSQQAS